MYKIKVISSFSAAHFLRGYKGKCENLHGHNWKVEVIVSALELDNLGMVMDFSQLKEELNAVLEQLDHKSLNDIAGFKTSNPSSEEICRFIFNTLLASLKSKPCKLEEIRVWETENSCATYSK